MCCCSPVSPAELAARASPTSGNPRGRTADLRLDFKSPTSGSLTQATMPQVVIVLFHFASQSSGWAWGGVGWDYLITLGLS